jgi:hypothetical protein
LAANVQRLNEYKSKLVLFPLNPKKTNKGEASADELSKVTQVRTLRPLFPMNTTLTPTKGQGQGSPPQGPQGHNCPSWKGCGLRQEHPCFRGVAQDPCGCQVGGYPSREGQEEGSRRGREATFISSKSVEKYKTRNKKASPPFLSLLPAFN